jgi:hypothetical protein
MFVARRQFRVSGPGPFETFFLQFLKDIPASRFAQQLTPGEAERPLLNPQNAALSLL